MDHFNNYGRPPPSIPMMAPGQPHMGFPGFPPPMMPPQGFVPHMPYHPQHAQMPFMGQGPPNSFLPPVPIPGAHYAPHPNSRMPVPGPVPIIHNVENIPMLSSHHVTSGKEWWYITLSPPLTDTHTVSHAIIYI
jgi:hypothetical protein